MGCFNTYVKIHIESDNLVYNKKKPTVPAFYA